MTLEDTKNLFVQLLSKHFRNHPKLRDPDQVEAYHEILAPYSPADVKAAALQCIREKGFFPDAQEIAAKCPPPAGPSPAAASRAWPGWPAYGYRDAEDYAEKLRGIIAKTREDAP